MTGLRTAQLGVGALSEVEVGLLRSLAAVDAVIEVLTGRPVIRPASYREDYYAPGPGVMLDTGPRICVPLASTAGPAASGAAAKRPAGPAVAPLRHAAPRSNRIVTLKFSRRAGLSQRHEAFLEALCGALAQVGALAGHPVLVDATSGGAGRRETVVIEGPFDGLEAHAALARGADPDGWVAA